MRLEDGGGQQGQRVGAARARDDDGVTGIEVGQRASYGEPHRGDRGVERHDSAVDAGDPERRVEDLLLGRQVGRLRPDRVEALHADLVDRGAHEDGAVAVLRHLLVQPQQPAQQPVERSDALASLGELAPDVRDAWGSPRARRRPSPRRRGPRAGSSRR